jgi:hypothetical protein
MAWRSWTFMKIAQSEGSVGMFKLVTASLLMLPVAFGQPSLTTAQIAKRLAPSVVVIQGKAESGDFVGSGFIVSKDGQIVTNLHVIKELNSASVQLADGQSFSSISVLGTDEQHDLAIIRVPGVNLTPVAVRGSTPPIVGEAVLIAGSPRGLEGTITAGILSSIRDSGEGYKVLQTDAAVNPGNSGGPMVNSKGQVIGVVSFKLRSSEGLNFAIPISHVVELLNFLHEPISLAQMRTNVAQINKTQNAPEIVTELSTAKIRTMLKAFGVGFTEQPAANGKMPSFLLQLGTYKALLLTEPRNFMLYGGFSVKVDLATVNAWNQKNRFSRAYLDDSGDPAIESDLEVSGGVTKDAIQAFIKQFETTMDVYSEALSTASSGQIQTTDTAPVHQKSTAATKRVKLPFGDFALSVDPTKWSQGASDGSILQFEHVNTEGYARIITERISIPVETLTEIALSNLKKSDPNAKITFQEKRVVNGRQVVAMYMDATVSKLPVRYYGYYYGGSSGTLQVITYTVSERFDSNVDEFTKFLDGLEISDQELQQSAVIGDSTIGASGVLSVNSGSMSVRYDSKKWKQKTSKEPGRFTFEHSTGDGYAMVIAERIGIPTDSLPDIALSNARESDPNARITFRDKRTVNGVEVWFLKLEAMSSGVPLTYYGYYYGGKSGTIQILTYTGTNLVKEYEKDFMEFLNGFRVTN